MEMRTFKNEPLIDWSSKKNQKRMVQALTTVRQKLGRNYPLIINGQYMFLSKSIISRNPSNFREVAGFVSSANSQMVDTACYAAYNAWDAWKKTPYKERARCLLRAAEIMRRRRLELIAWIIFEVGKSWQEADGDIAEAVDFLEFYARRMLEFGSARITKDIPGENNKTWYVPRGVVAVFGTWNFPFSINVGMVSAPIVTGNTVVFKPASLAAISGYKIAEIFCEAGLPSGVLNFIPGSGSEVGEALAAHSKIIGIAITGSKETGLRLQKVCAENPCEYGFKEILVGEFGGKDRIIIDSDADLDEAVRGVKESWLSAQGQKCSACSVVITVGNVHDVFLARLIEAARSLKIGSPEDPSVFLGPLIDDKALEKVKEYVEIGKSEGILAYFGNLPAGLAERGYYHPPVIFTDVDQNARIAKEEIFGPVLAIIKAESFDQALEIFNDSEYALTGGLYSRLPSHIECAKKECNVGNFYINRKIIGAFVSRQPFGGWKFSGTGSKAGSRDYLLRFMYQKTLSENTLRRGFAPL